MRKIPTIFIRDPRDMSKVLPAWHRDCLWVRDGEGVATRKYDGTCVMYDNWWWARRTVKPGAAEPPGFWAVETDPVTGKTVGWEPVDRSPFQKQLVYALDGDDDFLWETGTYELCGPQINGNPERLAVHELIRHATAQTITLPPLRDYGTLRKVCTDLLLVNHVEGIVFHHPDGRMAKIKGRDFA